MFELHDVSKSFDGQEVLKPLSLSFPTGRTTVLIGPSGCGKSTILRLLVRLLVPDRGRVVFEGNPLQIDNILLARRRMGYVIQDGGLFPHLTAGDNIALLARHVGWPTSKVQNRIEELAELTQLPADTLARRPDKLSGGQRQRVGLMRALMLDPPVLLLDEPLGALDPIVRFDLQEDLRRIFRQLQKTVIMVTHDMGEAAFFGDEVMLLDEGRLVQRGTITDLIDQPASDFVSRFLRAQRACKF